MGYVIKAQYYNEESKDALGDDDDEEEVNESQRVQPLILTPAIYIERYSRVACRVSWTRCRCVSRNSFA